jgi:uncharacterized protein (TIGR03067 family)
MNLRMAMTMAVALLIASVSLQAVAGGKEDAVKNDLKLLQGTWTIQSFESDGKARTAEQIKNIKLTIKDDRYSVEIGDKRIEMTFKIDPTKKPKQIDFTMTDGDAKAVTHAIYEVGADTLKICRPLEATRARPTAFATKEGSGIAMAVYKRDKK